MEMKIRVFDKIRQRYGRVLFISFFKGDVGYGVYDEHGDPVEVVPTVIKMEDAQIEIIVNGEWTPVQWEAM